MKPTLPTVGLLDRLPNGKPARSYTPSHMTNLRETFARLERQTFVVEYAKSSDAPRVGANIDDVLGGKLVAAQFADALAEIELLREHMPPKQLAAVDAKLAELWAQQR